MTPESANDNINEFVVSSTEIASFVYGTKPLRIWGSIYNKDNASLWQFRYDPLFIPEAKENFNLAIESKPIGGNGLWRTYLTIFLDTNEARRLAYAAVCKAYDSKKSDIQHTSVFVLPIREVKIKIPDLQNIYPNTHIVDDSFLFSAPATEFTVVIESKDEETARSIEKELILMRIEYEFSFSARQATQNWVRFSMKTIKESKLFVELNGVGSTNVYVHRDDMRKLLENITNQVDFEAIIEKPEDFEAGLLDKLLARWNTAESSSGFDALKWQSTYNKDDLNPDVITKELNKMFTKNEGEEQWKYNVGFSSGGKVGLVDFLSAEGNLSGSYSTEGLKKFLNEHQVEAEFEGTKIVAKSIRLQQVNISDFNQDTEFLSVRTFVQPSERMQSESFIELDRAVQLRMLHPDLSLQVSQIQQDTVPIGGIISFNGTLDQAEKLVDKGWWVCDGRVISDPLSVLYNGSATPNLLGRVLQGSTEANTIGGSASYNIPSQSIDITVVAGDFVAPATNNGPRLGPAVGEGWGNFHRTRSFGTVPVSGADVPTLPPFSTTIFITKVR